MPDKRIPYEKGISLEEAHADTRAALAGRVFIPYPEPPSLSTSGIMIPTYMRPYFESRGVAFKSNAPEEFYNAMYVSEHNSDGKRVPDQKYDGRYAPGHMSPSNETSNSSGDVLGVHKTVESSLSREGGVHVRRSGLAGTHPAHYGHAHVDYTGAHSGHAHDHANIDPVLLQLPHNSMKDGGDESMLLQVPHDSKKHGGDNSMHLQLPHDPTTEYGVDESKLPKRTLHPILDDGPDGPNEPKKRCRIPTPVYGGKGYFPDPYLDTETSRDGAINGTGSNDRTGSIRNHDFDGLPPRFRAQYNSPYRNLSVNLSGAAGYPHGRTSNVGELVPGHVTGTPGFGSYRGFSDRVDRSVLPSPHAYEVIPGHGNSHSLQHVQHVNGHESIAECRSGNTSSTSVDRSNVFQMNDPAQEQTGYSDGNFNSGYDVSHSRTINFVHDGTSEHQKTGSRGNTAQQNINHIRYKFDKAGKLPLSNECFREYMNGTREINGELAMPDVAPIPCTACVKKGLVCKVLSRNGDRGEVFTKMRKRWYTQEPGNYIVCANCWMIKSNECSFWRRPADK